MASRNGQLTFNFALLVPAENTAAVEEIIAAHAAWMKETHSLEAGSILSTITWPRVKKLTTFWIQVKVQLVMFCIASTKSTSNQMALNSTWDKPCNGMDSKLLRAP